MNPQNAHPRSTAPPISNNTNPILIPPELANPQMAEFIQNLVNSQVQQQLQQAEEHASARWKGQFNQLWDEREELYLQKLQEVEAAQALLQEQPQANLEVQESYMAAEDRHRVEVQQQAREVCEGDEY
ncbi:hypothetical protein FA13DRAFT_1714172 [Coprinellus micaceus]|uniref:Uncharacterized protein n=1 Tax=Coprinellus micaceus TaxID=71717 RepID=A0A4Y7ST38_COPMI|nr:hypothetical protein FA13DRAFT_1714172 [Coprinellus micaceus]